MSSNSQRKIFKDELQKLYLEDHLTDREIAYKLNCTKQTVFLSRKKFGIKALTPSQRNSKLITITPRQEEIIRGSLLGDAWIESGNVVGISHGKRQYEYIEWLSSQLQPYFGDTKLNRTCKQIRSCGHEFGEALHQEYYPDGTKRVSLEILNKLTNLSLAVWFMDDGQVLPRGSQSRLATCSFSEEENDMIKTYLHERWGILGDVRIYGGYRQIYFNKESTNKLVSIIRQHIPLCMRYKIWHTKNFAFYLSGGMEYKKDLGSNWRTWLTKELTSIGHLAIDPVKIELPDDDGRPLQDRLVSLKMGGRLEEVRKLVRRSLFRKDMLGIQLADAIVVLYDESVQRGAGTLSEVWESFREGRPVYLITDFSLDKIPTWLIGETTEIFTDFDQFLRYITTHNNMSRDLFNAEKLKQEFVTGIY